MLWLCALGQDCSVGQVRVTGDLETVGDFGGLNKCVLGSSVSSLRPRLSVLTRDIYLNHYVRNSGEGWCVGQQLVKAISDTLQTYQARLQKGPQEPAFLPLGTDMSPRD